MNRIVDKSIGDCRKFQNCFVKSQNAVRTTVNSLDLSQSPILFTPPTRQDKTRNLTCPCLWYVSTTYNNRSWQSVPKLDLEWPWSTKLFIRYHMHTEFYERLMLRSLQYKNGLHHGQVHWARDLLLGFCRRGRTKWGDKHRDRQTDRQIDRQTNACII